MTLKYKNNAQTTLSAGIDSSVTSISVVDGSVFPTLTGAEYFYMTLEDVSLNREVVKVTARSGNTLTVVRGQDGTTARAFSIADKAEGRLVAAMLADLSAPSYILSALLTVDGVGSGLDADLLDGQSSAYYLAASNYTAADVLSKILTVDGPGSGLDADLLDGQSSAYYLAASNYTAADVLSKLLTVDGAGSGLDADLLDGQSSAYYLASGSYTAADVLSKLLTVDGAGSGLDADLLDGMSVTTSGAINSILGLDSGGTATAQQFMASAATPYYGLYESDAGADLKRWYWVAVSGGLSLRMINDVFTADASLINVHSRSSYTTASIDFPAAVTALTRSSNTIWHAGNDGAGSGLDADLLDGLNSSAFVRNNNGQQTFIGATAATYQHFIVLSPSDSGANKPSLYFTQAAAESWTIGLYDGTDSNGLINIGSSSFQHNGSTVWTAANDGAGSGLDADTVDGYQASSLGRLAVAQSWTAQQTFDYDGTTIFNDPTGDYILQFNTSGTARGYIGADATYSFSVRNTGGTRLLSAANSSGVVELFSADVTSGPIRILPTTSGLQHFDGAGNYRWIEGVRSDITGNVNDWTLYNNAGGETIRAYHSTRVVNFPGSITIAGSTVWHAGNDGAGSGLDADLLDGLTSSQFVRQDAATALASGATIITISNTNSGVAALAGDFSGKLETRGNGTGAALITFHRPGAYAAHFGLDTDNTLRYGGWSLYPNAFLVWHAGNDGAGSGLDADTIDGINSSDIVYGLSGGYGTNAGITNMNAQAGYTTTTQRSGFFTSSNPTNSPNGDWVHWIQLQGGVWGAGSEYGFQMAHGFWNNNMWVRKVNNGTWGSWTKMWNADNDGSGSGLDADLLDGYTIGTSGANIPICSGANTFSGACTFTANLTLSSSGVPLVVNSTNANALKIAMQDAGSIRGYLGADSTYSTYVANGAATILTRWTHSNGLMEHLYDLTVSGDIRVNGGQLFFESSTYLNYSGSQQLDIVTNGSTRMRVDSAGLVSFYNGVSVAGGIQARTSAGTTTTGTLVVADANTRVTLTGGITMPNAVFSAGDMHVWHAGTSARTITRGASVTMYVNGTDVASATLAANSIGGAYWSSSSVVHLTGAIS